MSTASQLLLADVRRRIHRPALGKYLADTFDELPLPLSSWLGHEVMGLVQVDEKGLELSEDERDPSLIHEPLSHVQFGILRHAEQIYFPETYEALRRESRDVRWRAQRFVNFIWMMVGKGGGKDRVAALAHLRIVYLLMCLTSPQRYQKIGSTSKIDLLNTASSEGQAQAIYFAELKGLLDHSPWFEGKYRPPAANKITYDKRIIGHSGNSKEESQEGMNLIFGCLDEIDAFRTKEELEKTARTARGAMLNAQGIFDMMRTSGGSRFPFTFKVLGLSWPRYVGSFIWNKHRDGLKDLEERGSACRTYVIPSEYGATTWESNPTKSQSDYAADFEENPELALAKYMCRPPTSEAPYFRNKEAIDESFSPYDEDAQPVKVTYRWGSPPLDELEQGPLGYRLRTDEVTPPEGWQADIEWREDFLCTTPFLRAIHVDTGISNDRCGIAMSHVRGYSTTREERSEECASCSGVGRLRNSLAVCPDCQGKRVHVTEVLVHRPLVTTDLITYFSAPPAQGDHPRGEVELRWVRRLIFDLIARGFPVRRVTFDGYQSTDSRQILTSHGIETDLLSLDRNMSGYDTAKSILYAGGLECPAHPLLITELKALTVLGGRKVDHPPGGSKDLADAWAGSVVGAIVLAEHGAVTEDSVAYDAQAFESDRLRGIETRLPSLPSVPADLIGYAGPPR